MKLQPSFPGQNYQASQLRQLAADLPGKLAEAPGNPFARQTAALAQKQGEDFLKRMTPYESSPEVNLRGMYEQAVGNANSARKIQWVASAGALAFFAGAAAGGYYLPPNLFTESLCGAAIVGGLAATGTAAYQAIQYGKAAQVADELVTWGAALEHHKA